MTKPFHYQELQARVETQLELGRQRRELEIQYAALRRLEGLRDSFTHMVAHDMRGPLSAILASLELSLADLSGPAAGLGPKLRMAHEGATRLDAMISHMLELSRMESGTIPLDSCRCDLVRLVRRAVEAGAPMLDGRRVTVEADAPVYAWCDPVVIDRVLANLLDNALKFTSPQGTVRVLVAVDPEGARVAVRDGRSGRRPRTPAVHLQEVPPGPWWRPPATGWASAWRSASPRWMRTGGRIGVDSQPGQGCTFWFTLPVEAPAG